ncbi:portal protein [Gellertiella hungarica]|uniref:Uncharacterized protein n=1 Tax=Gellertiella hungarica TaxID=1572859 RepID=A0A7W6NMM1_9HYPH|nr:portal protein [Gellertiella hungarica]MBB4066759.1 hypothetical protein [Gellertiella hungarica]
MQDKAGQGFPSKQVTEEALRRLKQARAQKALVRPDLQEAYFFTRPRLSTQVDSTSKPSRPSDDADDLATGIGSEVSEDFATEVVAAFFPQGTEWVEAGVDESQLVGVPANERAKLEKDLKARNSIIFSAIRASNFEAELGTVLDPGAAVGTVAWWIDKPFNTRPTRVEAVPTRELEFNVEADGSVGDRFRVRHVSADRVETVIPGVPLPDAVKRKISSMKNGTIEIVWCFWRNWDRPEDDRWNFVLLVDKIAVNERTMEGEGCIPLIIARFSPDPNFAWGYGPSIKALQDYRVLDVITAATQDRIDIALAPPLAYPDDGVLNFENGLEAGKAYPSRPGSGRDIQPLYFEGNPDLGFYSASDLERRIRRKHFADYPEQKGDTPPTATQWADEMVKAQRRIGTPGKKFWREGPYEIYRRFEWLLTKDAKIADVTLNGQPITLVANNPATQAADNQKVQIATQLLSLAKGMFPETAQAAIDERATIENVKRLMKDEVVKLRDEEQTAQLVRTVLGAAQDAGMLTAGGQ